MRVMQGATSLMCLFLITYTIADRSSHGLDVGRLFSEAEAPPYQARPYQPPTFNGLTQMSQGGVRRRSLRYIC